MVFGGDMINETIDERCHYCNRKVVVLRRIKKHTLIIECLFCGKKSEVDKK